MLTIWAQYLLLLRRVRKLALAPWLTLEGDDGYWLWEDGARIVWG